MAANHSQSTQLNASMQQLLSVLRDPAFCSTLNLELKSENSTQTGTLFRFHHGVTFTSWGEKITLTLTPLSATSTKIHAHSECGLPTQVIDWGKNKQNVSNILQYIEKNLPAAPSAAFTADTPAVGVKYCFKCGKQICADYQFCIHCGQKQG